MKSHEETDALNQRWYLDKEVAGLWAERADVMPEEAAFLQDFGGEVKGARILDIGVGAGRSTRYLLPLAGDYTGIDYSSDMVAAAAAQIPGARLEVGDARDLSRFQDGQFDFVLFSFNGIDCLAHEGRMQTMAEVSRVLAPGGLFGFSSHNREQPPTNPYSLEHLYFSKRPRLMWKYLLMYLNGIRAWRRTEHTAMICDEYELRHDNGNLFSAPHYYVTKSAQTAQTEPLGFELLAVYNTEGRQVTPAAPDNKTPWFLYAFRKK